MKLLLDENLSPRLTALLSDLYPGSRHVEDCGLISASDEEVWHYAMTNDFAIVSKDSDFADRSALRGGPPKILWLRSGNCTTARALAALREASSKIQAFLESSGESCLVITPSIRKPVHRAELYLLAFRSAHSVPNC